MDLDKLDPLNMTEDELMRYSGFSEDEWVQALTTLVNDKQIDLDGCRSTLALLEEDFE
jgi:hypothetical protein